MKVDIVVKLCGKMLFETTTEWLGTREQLLAYEMDVNKSGSFRMWVAEVNEANEENETETKEP